MEGAIDRKQSFQTMVNRDSDVMANTFSSPIGTGRCVHDREIGVVCAAGTPWTAAFRFHRQPESKIPDRGGRRHPRSEKLDENWRSPVRACPGISSWVE